MGGGHDVEEGLGWRGVGRGPQEGSEEGRVREGRLGLGRL